MFYFGTALIWLSLPAFCFDFWNLPVSVSTVAWTSPNTGRRTWSLHRFYRVEVFLDGPHPHLDLGREEDALFGALRCVASIYHNIQLHCITERRRPFAFAIDISDERCSSVLNVNGILFLAALQFSFVLHFVICGYEVMFWIRNCM